MSYKLLLPVSLFRFKDQLSALRSRLRRDLRRLSRLSLQTAHHCLRIQRRQEQPLPLPHVRCVQLPPLQLASSATPRALLGQSQACSVPLRRVAKPPSELVPQQRHKLPPSQQAFEPDSHE